MALFSFECPTHGIFYKMLEKGEKSHKCPECNLDSIRILKVGTVRVTEVIDNGLMSKSIERPQDIDEMMEERIVRQEQRNMPDDPV